MTTIFAVVGEHRDDPDRLLLLGEDGRYYAYDVAAAPVLPTRDLPPVPVDPTPDWVVDAAAAEQAML